MRQDQEQRHFENSCGTYSEKAMAPHFSTLAQKIPWMEEPGRLQSMGSPRVGHDFTFTFTFHFSLLCIGKGNGNPLQCSCLENPRDRGAWWAAVYGVAKSWTRLKRLSSSSSSSSMAPICFKQKSKLVSKSLKKSITGMKRCSKPLLLL